MFHSFRTRLQTAFVLLGVAAIAFTGWQASSGATEALREATYDRLNAIRETRARQIERYFTDVRNHVLALSTDESTVDAIERFTTAWGTLPAALEPAGLRDYFRSVGAPEDWFPEDPHTLALQSLYIAQNPHPHGAKDLLVTARGASRYGEIHTRYHPTFHRYQMAFGFYDIFLIGLEEGNVLYSVMKEVDIGVPLTRLPYSDSGLARVYERALELGSTDDPVIQDYTPYPPSSFAPAAFVAAPVRRAGETIGVLAIQVSIDEINDVMTGGGRWMEEGLGGTGQSYVVGPDGTLRSDLRFALEDPEAYYRDLAAAGISNELIQQIRSHGTGVLAFPANLSVSRTIREGEGGTELGRNLRGEEALRSNSHLNIGGLNWTLVAEIETEEAFAPVIALRNRIAGAGLLIAGLFFLAAGWIGASVTRPVRALAFAARRLGQGDLDARIHIKSPDEIGQLAADFNRMVEDLQRTTVSKAELQALAGRLITAQEDERRRLARELHDDVTQRLAAAAIEIGRLAKEQDSAALAHLKTDMARISDDIHSLSRGLHPRLLDDLGLAAAVEAECRAFFERGGPVAEFRAEGDPGNLPRDTQLALYRITQEALNNILRHAEASEVEIQLRRDPEAVNLTIRDNGRGFDTSGPDWHPGLGLASMEERTRLMSGAFHVASKPGQGTTIEVSLPLS